MKKSTHKNIGKLFSNIIRSTKRKILIYSPQKLQIKREKINTINKKKIKNSIP